MSMIWFTSDWHLGHANIIQYAQRPFRDTEEMDRTILENFRARVAPHDTVYFLGDLTFNKELARQFLSSIPRSMAFHFIRGNHDNWMSDAFLLQFCRSVSELKTIREGPHHIVLCHYAMRVWPKSRYDAWQLYGHSHGNLPPVGKQWDVGVDSNDYQPVSLAELETIMQERPGQTWPHQESAETGSMPATG